jgi:hypothetical protein
MAVVAAVGTGWATAGVVAARRTWGTTVVAAIQISTTIDRWWKVAPTASTAIASAIGTRFACKPRANVI